MAEKRKGSASSGRETVTTGPGVAAEETRAPAPDVTLPDPEPRLGPQQERRGRAEYHVKTGVAQIMHFARLGDSRQLEDVSRRLLRRAYGLE